MALFNRPNSDPEWFSNGREVASRSSAGQRFFVILAIHLVLLITIFSLVKPKDADQPRHQVSKQPDAMTYCSVGPPYTGGASNGGPPPGDKFKPC